MDQNKQRLQQHLLTSFSQGFPGLSSGATNNDLLSLQLLSGLSAPSLLQATPTLSTNDLTQWAAAQQQSQWLVDQQAKVAAAMFGGMGMFGGMSGGMSGVKGMDLTNNTDLTKAFVSASTAKATSANPSPTIFPTMSSLRNEVLNGAHLGTPVNIDGVDGSPAGPSSANPGSHKSISTPNDIDVGAISQPNSQADQGKHESPSRKLSHMINRQDMDLPSTTLGHQYSHFDFPSTSSSFMQKEKDDGQKESNDPWATLDLNDINDLLTVTGTSSSTYDSTNLEFDKEFEKVFSIVQSRDGARRESIDKDRDKDKDKDKDNFDFGLLDENPALSPVQFTPPDSPTHEGNATDLTALFSMGASPPKISKKEIVKPTKVSSMKSFLPSVPSTSTQNDLMNPMVKTSPPKKESIFKKKEPIFRKESSIFARKSSKAPVYKQKSTTILDYNEDKGKKIDTKDDEYSFTDEEDDMTAMVEEAKKENRLQEEIQKRLTQTGPNSTNKSVYVPGIGFAAPKEQPVQELWSHVVPKKRFGAEGSKTGIPPTTLLPPTAQVETPSTATVVIPEILTLADTIRKRKQEREKKAFCKTKISNDCYCPRENGIIQVFDGKPVEPGTLPPIPKLRISRKILAQFSEEPNNQSDVENYQITRKMKRRRKTTDEDSDWRGWTGNKTRKQQRKERNMRRRSSRLLSEQPYTNGYGGESCEPQVVVEELFTTQETKADSLQSDPVMMSKKARLLQQWQETEAGTKEEEKPQPLNGTRRDTSLKIKIVKTARNEQQNQEIKTRLAAFGSAEGHLPKGTFVVCKKDLFKDDCALWRVDNQNMLQKYPPRIDSETKRVTYKNSSTYSGWCEQIASDYATIAIRYNKQTRSEAIVEPEVPLSDLFPAITAELNGSTEACAVVKEDEPKDPIEMDASFLLGDPTRMTLHTYISAMLQHVLTLNYFKEVREKNESLVFQSMVDVARNNMECLEKLRSKANWDDDFEENLDKYLQITSTELDLQDIDCQACQQCLATKIEQFFDLHHYNRETLQAKQKRYNDSPLRARELFVCDSCLHLSQLFHKCLHMRYFLFKQCEDRLEELGNESPESAPEKLVEKARSSSNWMLKLVRQNADLWKKIKSNDFLM